MAYPPPYQPPNQPPYQPPYQQMQPYYQQVYIQQPPQRNGGAIAVEAILAIFGIYGVGWLMSGKTGVGMLFLIGGFLWDITMFGIAVFTAGLGLCFMVPIHFCLIATSTIILANQSKS